MLVARVVLRTALRARRARTHTRARVCACESGRKRRENREREREREREAGGVEYHRPGRARSTAWQGSDRVLSAWAQVPLLSPQMDGPAMPRPGGPYSTCARASPAIPWR
eukprot:2737535-Rhodomonas_salina.2